jgi:hypothetical protein
MSLSVTTLQSPGADARVRVSVCACAVVRVSCVVSHRDVCGLVFPGICALLFSLVATWIDIGMYHEAKSFDDYPAVQITYDLSMTTRTRTRTRTTAHAPPHTHHRTRTSEKNVTCLPNVM